MHKKIRFLFILAAVAITGIILMQSLWIFKYYEANRKRFIHEIDEAFNISVKKEFQLRNDSLEEMLYRFVLDTNNVKIYSKLNKYSQLFVYTFESLGDSTPNHTGFSSDQFNEPLASQTDPNRPIVARLYARSYRKRDLDNNIIHYDRQNIGKFLSKNMSAYEFDTNNLKKTYKALLAEKDIDDSFHFQLVKQVSKTTPTDSATQAGPFLTASLPTHDISFAYQFIRAVFPSAANYLLRQLLWMTAGSMILLLIVGFSLLYMVRLLQREKKATLIKNDFINNITHELKTPIATISTAIEAFEHFDALKDEQKTKKYLQTSREQVDRLSDLVSKILNISIYERQEFDLKIEAVDLNQLMSDLIKNFTLLHGHALTLHFNPLTAPAVIKADKTNLYSAISNIIDNAIKYTKRHPVITINIFDDGRCYVIEVRDNGIGIEAEDLSRIFEKFYRVPSKEHSTKGYGLGLFYVNSIVEKHKGWLTVQSTPGEGSIFKLALPHD